MMATSTDLYTNALCDPRNDQSVRVLMEVV